MLKCLMRGYFILKRYVEKPKYTIFASFFNGKLTDEFKGENLSLSKTKGYCPFCGKPLKKHLTDGINEICPNSYVLFGKHGIQGMSKENFEDMFMSLDTEDILDVGYL